jgi:hypothetical protein
VCTFCIYEDEDCVEEGISAIKALTKKAALGSSPGEDGFCSSEIKHGKRKGTNFATRKVSWVQAQLKVLV